MVVSISCDTPGPVAHEQAQRHGARRGERRDSVRLRVLGRARAREAQRISPDLLQGQSRRSSMAVPMLRMTRPLPAPMVGAYAGRSPHGPSIP